VHLVGFIIRNLSGCRSHERQIRADINSIYGLLIILHNSRQAL